MKTEADRNVAIHSAYVPLRIAFGLVPILAGLDKFMNQLADWQSYIAPWAEHLLPVSPKAFLGIVGVIEIAVGVLVWTRHVRLGAHAAAGWLSLVAINLVLAGFPDIAVRDLVLAVAAFALAHLAEAQALEHAGRESTEHRGEARLAR
jgi:uncharacterized membrane protein YphA (DoxX/SURF4 family)